MLTPRQSESIPLLLLWRFVDVNSLSWDRQDMSLYVNDWPAVSRSIECPQHCIIHGPIYRIWGQPVLLSNEI